MTLTKKLNGHFYKIDDCEELIRTGAKFLVDIENGINSFAFTSTGYKNSQQRTILGLCCYLDQFANGRVAVVSDNLSHGVFSDLVEMSHLDSHHLSSGEDILKFKAFHRRFDFIEYDELKKIFDHPKLNKSFNAEVSKILENYEIILWDLPEMEQMKKNSSFHCQIANFYESMTVIVTQTGASGTLVEAATSFFNNYNINLNEVSFDTSSPRENPVRKKFLGLF